MPPSNLPPGVHEVSPARAVLLSGEHPTLPVAELRALLDVHDPRGGVHAQGLVAVVQPGNPAGCDAALTRMALAHEWGDLWAQAPETPEGLAQLAALVRARATGQGPAAVATERRGEGKGLDRAAVERTLGAALKDAGHPIDLKAPATVLFAWLTDGRIAIGLRRGQHDRSRFEARISDERAHFSPVGMHPRRAACLLHLARAAPGSRVYDPFCGTGGMVLEAALEGHDAWGSDLDSFMVQGTLQTLADAASDPLDGHVFVADIGEAPGLVGTVDAVVTDLPYGRGSSTDGEPLRELYGRAFAAFAALLPSGGHAVVGHSDPALLTGLEAHGFRVIERHAEPVHRSLVRHYAVAVRL
ncbi:MAG TPA: THUMP domain-containing protein [Candidatus Thermoplasmatota archaeon]|nr:THUMP domain-containing protein [Candidatus Thermoplasmatota archaeon]